MISCHTILWLSNEKQENSRWLNFNLNQIFMQSIIYLKYECYIIILLNNKQWFYVIMYYQWMAYYNL